MVETRTNTNIRRVQTVRLHDNEEGSSGRPDRGVVDRGLCEHRGTSTSTVNPFQTFERHDVGLQLGDQAPALRRWNGARLALYIEDSSIASGPRPATRPENDSFPGQRDREDGRFVVSAV